MTTKYVIGVDFGTESGRAVLVDVTDGQEIANAVYFYANKVIDEILPESGLRLEPQWALQDPNDYLETLRQTIPAVLRNSDVLPAQVVGLGIDFTACTLLPVTADGTPLCFLPQWRNHPHAWVKLWKHHAAQPEADRINETARATQQSWLARYGGKVSSEWFFSKTLQILNEAPEIYQAADRLIEAADWITWQLTGVEKRNACCAGYKALWSKRQGYPPDSFFAALDPRLEHVVDEKMSRQVFACGDKAGGLTAQAAALTGLLAGTAVAVANVDAHVSVPAAGVVEPGRMAMIMGTSICHMVLGVEEHIVPGTCGYVEDGIIPGFFGYEAGQAGAGDILAWFVGNAVPPEYHAEARQRSLDLYQLLEEKAAQVKPGTQGLLALDWWNGNRSVLVDGDLSGLLVGATLATKAEDIYRTLIEASAFGTRLIIETFEKHGVPVYELVACGGLPEKNRLLMQIFSDVTGREFKVAASRQASALGSAMFGAVAAGKAAGGYDTIVAAARRMAHLKAEVFRPIPGNQSIYQRLYAEYVRLYDYFGRGENQVMKTLQKIRDEARKDS